jgi:group I intron endonuclease
MDIYSIYKIVNRVNGKQYIGYTSKIPAQRWNEHIYTSHDPQNPNHRYIHKAIRKYGPDALTFEVIYQSKERRHTHKVMEPFFIKEYDTFGPNGYNLTEGGDGKNGYKLSEDTKKKISNSLKGKTLSGEAKAKISSAKKGVKFTDQHRANKSATWKITRPDGVEEIIVNKDEYCRQHGLNGSSMSQVAKGTRRHYKGYTCVKL